MDGAAPGDDFDFGASVIIADRPPTRVTLAVAFGRSAKDAALNGQVIPAKKLEEIAAK